MTSGPSVRFSGGFVRGRGPKEAMHNNLHNPTVAVEFEHGINGRRDACKI